MQFGCFGYLLELAKAHVTDSEPDLSPVKSLHINDKLLATALVGGDR